MFQGLSKSKFGTTPLQGHGLGTGLRGTGTGLGGGGLGIGGTGTSTGVFNTGTATEGNMSKSGGLGGLGDGPGGGMFQTPSSSSGFKFGSGAGLGFGGGVSGGAVAASVGTPTSFSAVKAGTDTDEDTSITISTRLLCATAMKEYEQKSLEELRYEDYECGRKGRMGGMGMFNQSGGIGGGTSTSLGVGGGMFSQNNGLMDGTSKSGMFSNTETGLGGLGMNQMKGESNETSLRNPNTSQPPGGMETTSELGTLNSNGIETGNGTGLGSSFGVQGMEADGMGLDQSDTTPLSYLTAQQQLAQLQQQIEILQQAPFGDSPLFRNSMSDSDKKKKPHEPTPVSYKITPTASPQYKLNIRSSTKYKPMSFNSPGLQKEKSMLFKGLDDSILPVSKSFTPRSSIKKLTIKPRHKRHSPYPLPDSTSVPYTETMSATMKTTPTAVPQPDTPYSNPILKPKPIRVTHSTPVTIVTTDTSVTTITPTFNLPLPPLPLSPPTPPPQLVLTKDGYYTNPPLTELQQRITDGDSIVENFTIGRKNHGEILFIGKTDVQGLNLDELVVINPKEVSVYPDECADSKPPVGSGLNKKAQVCLEGYWPKCKTNRVPIKDPSRLAEMNYIGKLRKATEKIGAHFIDYIPDNGICIFEVSHFSKYQLVANDSEDESNDDPAIKNET